MDGFYVNFPGAQTSVQDEGRFGYQWSGMCPAGAMDLYSLRVANILVGNDRNEAGLEITLIGPELKFLVDEVIAITGADLSPVLDGVNVPMYRAVSVKKGQTLQFGTRKSGCRAYIAFAGGLDVEPMFGSRSTWVRINIGPVDHALKKGDIIGFRAPKSDLKNMEARWTKAEAINGDDVLLRVIPGPQDYLFTEAGICKFFSGEHFTVSKLASRQGYRLEGPKVELKQKGSIVSDGIAKGAVQIQPNEQPIVLLSERQSTGGYAKIGNIISVDLPKIGQAMSGSKICFQKCSVEEAQDLLFKEYQALTALEEKIQAAKENIGSRYRITVNQRVYNVEIRKALN